MRTGDKMLTAFGALVVASVLLLLGLSLTTEGLEHGRRIPLLVGGALLLIDFSLVALLGLRALAMRHASWRTQMWVALGVGALAAVAFIGYRSTEIEPRPSYDPAFWDRLRPVCSGTGAAGAGDYGRVPGAHGIVAVGPDGDTTWTDGLPVEWLPNALGDTELVLCLGPDEAVEVEFCPYFGAAGIRRFRHERVFTLREARTGDSVDSNTFRGPMPEVCPSSKPVGTTELHGNAAGIGADVVDWLRSYVMD